eukprot:XP_017951883.1 PREDICTED: antigen peptide transporter 1-like [Xenopus tropicalis]
MHHIWTLCFLFAVDFASMLILRLFLTYLLPIYAPIILAWLAGLVRFVILSLGICTVRSRSKLPPWLQGDHLALIGTVLSFLVPFCAAVIALVSLRSSTELLYSWSRWDVFLLCYLLTVTSGILWHQLFPHSTKEKIAVTSSASLRRLITLLQPYVHRFLLVAVFLVLSSWSEMALPSYTGRMTDWIANKEDPSAFTSAIIAMSLITAASAVTEFVCDCIYNVTMSMIHTHTQGQVLRSVLKQEMAFFDSESTVTLSAEFFKCGATFFAPERVTGSSGSCALPGEPSQRGTLRLQAQTAGGIYTLRETPPRAILAP